MLYNQHQCADTLIFDLTDSAEYFFTGTAFERSDAYASSIETGAVSGKISKDVSQNINVSVH